MSLPSPQNVGREFVRQYYTLLNQSPIHLHRFYSSNSSFTHGGLSEATTAEAETEAASRLFDAPVTGQKQIHEKIMSLNFRDCHAKIRQVDAHATLDSGVVVQVSGELSNNGGPMRRFMQTFVLAPQSPKKYYVHNDIFRYQDEVFSDEDHETPPNNNNNPTSATDPHHHLDEDPIPNNKGNIMTNRGVDGKENHSPTNVVIPSSSNNNNSEEQLLMNGGVPPVATTKETTPTTTTLPDVTSPTLMNDEPFVNNTKEENEDKEISTTNEEDIVESSDNSVSNGPITYAKLVKSGPSAGSSLPPIQQQGFNFSSSPSLTMNNNSHFGSNKFNKNSGSSSTTLNNNASDKEFMKGGSVRGGISSNRGMIGRNNSREQQQRNFPRNTDDESDRPPRGSPRLTDHHGRPATITNTPTTSANPPFSDSQQLFVGNLPHNCSVGDLQSLFAKYGKVIEVRINGRGASLTKTNPSGLRVPNYGFVVFEDESSVTECLKKKPIFLPEGNHRLNIEEKKVNKGRNSGAVTNPVVDVPIVRFERGSSQDLLGAGRGASAAERGSVRGGSRPGSRGGRGVYQGGTANRGGNANNGQLAGQQQQQQRGSYNRRS